MVSGEALEEPVAGALVMTSQPAVSAARRYESSSTVFPHPSLPGQEDRQTGGIEEPVEGVLEFVEQLIAAYQEVGVGAERCVMSQDFGDSSVSGHR